MVARFSVSTTERPDTARRKQPLFPVLFPFQWDLLKWQIKQDRLYFATLLDLEHQRTPPTTQQGGLVHFGLDALWRKKNHGLGGLCAPVKVPV